MARFRRTIIALLIYCSTQWVYAQSRSAESQATQSTRAVNADGGLTMTIIGNGKLQSGHKMAFRTYKAQDGSEGEVTYATLPTVQEAERQIAEWSKFAKRITTREHNMERRSILIDDRIVGSRKLILKDASKKRKARGYMIIRRDGLNCYFIESLSLQTAIKIEGLID